MSSTTLDRPAADDLPRAGLPSSFYADPAHLVVERDQLFARTWTALASAQAIAAPGDVACVDFLGIPILLVRDRDGSARAFHNVCSHRGLKLVTEDASGQNVVRCPYHSWAYALDGRLVATPHIGGQDVHGDAAINPAEYGLKPIALTEWAGVLFVNLSGTEKPLAQVVAPLLERWQGYQFDGLRHAGTMSFDVAANWKFAVENFVESYHLYWVHPALNEYSPAAAHYEVILPGCAMGTGNDAGTVPGADGLPAFPGLAPQDRGRIEALATFPNLALVVMPDHIVTLVLTPVAPDRTLERFDFWFLPDPEWDAHAAIRAAGIERWGEINGEDIGMLERLQAGRASPAFDGGVLAMAWERPVAEFNRLVRQALCPAP
ncbi:aromatic ring-hydroxylating oxygenase subunit alpha [Zavarzinia sp. CC-PAN008]|uniref:aromatic ring-hydroxylating oxygenase subunit alpha n=1 Tax=Zavarzinia sp. CC-PAN008 TaxID=3243332 RepID=UPI003F746ADF